MTDSSEPGPDDHALSRRRRLLGWLIGGISAFVTAAVGIPVVGALAGSAFGRRPETAVRLGKLADFPLGQPKLAQFALSRTDGWVTTLESRAVWVVRTGELEATVFNGRCTHLGCAYSWKTEGPRRGQFFCPCHDGVFGPDGKVLGGPPPRALDTLPVRVEDGVLAVSHQDFRLGVAEKAPA